MDAKYYKFGENPICNEVTIRQSLLRHLSQNKELSSASSISPSVSVSIGESSVISQFPAFCHENQINRLTYDQGLIVPKERPSIPRRKIKDKSYYKGLIHLKIKKIKDELKKLLKEVTLLSADQQTYVPYKEEAKSRVMELQNLQKTLAEYNLLDDMLHRHVQLEEAKQGLQELKAVNSSENTRVEKLFAMTELKEIKVKDIESIITQENDVSEILTKTMDSQVSDKIRTLKSVDLKLQILRNEQEEQFICLKDKRYSLENQCNQNAVLKKKLQLTKTLWSSREKKNKLLQENKFVSSQEEYKYLKKHQAECSVILKGMIQENQNVENKIQTIVEELRKIENQSGNQYSNVSSKYSKLLKQEGIINEFFSSYSHEQNELSTDRQQKEYQIVKLLEDICRKSNSFGFDLQNKHNKIFFTNNECIIAEKKMEYLKALEEYEHMENLELKLLSDRDHLNDEISACKSKILTVSNIDKSKKDLETKQLKLLNELNQVKKQLRDWKHTLDDREKYYNSLQGKLQDSETYTISSKLEERSHLLENKNSVTENSEVSKDFQDKYLMLKSSVRKLCLELNSML